MDYYLTKSNPNRYKLQDALHYYRSVPDVRKFWTICKNAELGGILFIGQSGEEAGIYAKAIVADTTTFEELDDRFWVDPKEVAGKLVWAVPIEGLALMKHPVLERHIKAFPELERVAKWLHCQGAVRHLSDEEGKALLRFV